MPRWPKKVELVDGAAVPQPTTAPSLEVEFPKAEVPAVSLADTLALNPVAVAIDRTNLLMPLFDDIVKANERDSRRVAARNGIVKALNWLKQIEGGTK
jgi:hypothetical protein